MPFISRLIGAMFFLGSADWVNVTSYGEYHVPIILYTDCKSLFDHLKKDGAVPDDKWVAVAVASLKGAVSAGPGQNLSLIHI